MPTALERFLPTDPAARAVALGKISRLAEIGLDAVVADFDMTLTDDASVSFFALICTLGTTPGVEERYYLSEAFIREAVALEEKYVPVIWDPATTREEKIAACEGLWAGDYAAFARHGLYDGYFSLVLDHPISRAYVNLRPGTRDFAAFLARRDIPLVVFSAWLGDMILEYLRREDMLSSGVHLVSNVCEYDADGIFRGTLRGGHFIHSLSKDESHIRERLDRDVLSGARTALLLGDHIGDARMLDDRDGRSVLRVGIHSNPRHPDISDEYRAAFDLVLRADDVEGFYRGLVALLSDGTV